MGNAVKRNRAKRRLRALFIQTLPTIKNGSYILVAKSPIIAVDYHELEQGWYKALQRTRALKSPRQGV